jgi:hypothetical protein
LFSLGCFFYLPIPKQHAGMNPVRANTKDSLTFFVSESLVLAPISLVIADKIKNILLVFEVLYCLFSGSIKNLCGNISFCRRLLYLDDPEAQLSLMTLNLYNNLNFCRICIFL